MINVEIYFDAGKHKYTDNFGNVYTSVTTLISKYENKFDAKKNDIAQACEKIGRNPRHPKYPKYKGKSAEQILSEWEQTSKDALVIGNETHDYIEDRVKLSSYFDKFRPKSNRRFTINDLTTNSTLGYLDLKVLKTTGFEDRFPRVFALITAFVNHGWRVFSEIVVYDYTNLVCGLIDILLIKDDEFIILDWKTNKHPIQFQAGYYEKDNQNNVIGYKLTNETLKYPLNKLADSTGIKYTLQTSLYGALAERFGYKLNSIIICQILHDLYPDSKDKGKRITNFLPISYIKDDVHNMIQHYVTKGRHVREQKTLVL